MRIFVKFKNQGEVKVFKHKDLLMVSQQYEKQIAQKGILQVLKGKCGKRLR